MKGRIEPGQVFSVSQRNKPACSHPTPAGNWSTCRESVQTSYRKAPVNQQVWTCSDQCLCNACWPPFNGLHSNPYAGWAQSCKLCRSDWLHQRWGCGGGACSQLHYWPSMAQWLFYCKPGYIQVSSPVVILGINNQFDTEFDVFSLCNFVIYCKITNVYMHVVLFDHTSYYTLCTVGPSMPAWI